MRTRRSIVLGAAAAIAVILPMTAAGARAATSTPSVAGTSPVLVQGGRDLGPSTAPAVQVTLAVPFRNTAALQALIARQRTPGSADYQRYLSPGQFASQFSPAAATVTSVAAWATSHQLAVSSISANRTLVAVSGTPQAVGRAFGVTLDDFTTPQGIRYFSPTSQAVVPAALASKVGAIVGLSNLGRVSTVAARPSSGSAASPSFPGAYGPQDFWSFYHAPASATGGGQTLAILAEGNLAQPKKDLVTFEDKFGLAHVPWTTIAVGPASADTSGSDEWDLDTQYSTGFAPAVSSLLVYDGASLSNPDILAEINKFVTDDRSKQASFSAGECELLANATGFQASVDQALTQAVSQGQTLFSSSGDTGSFCSALIGVNGVPLGVPGQNYPAASPFVVGVGGTTILGQAPPLREISWYSGGGGISLTEPVPAYQAAAGGSFVPVRRGVPDVALDADPNSGYRVIVNGQETIIGGTSASSPSWLGIWTRAQGAQGGNLGFADNVIYREPATSFNDIVAGNNVPYPATPGWDYTTGRGTPDITAFVGAA